jgi:hypothetical protein
VPHRSLNFILFKGWQDFEFEDDALAVNTQIHPATFGGIANRDYTSNFNYAQGISTSNFRPFPCSRTDGFYHILAFSQPGTGTRGFDW